MPNVNAEQFAAAVDKARKHVDAMDRIDGRKDRAPRTILAALEAGIRNPDNGAALDAYVMLQDFFSVWGFPA